MAHVVVGLIPYGHSMAVLDICITCLGVPAASHGSSSSFVSCSPVFARVKLHMLFDLKPLLVQHPQHQAATMYLVLRPDLVNGLHLLPFLALKEVAAEGGGMLKAVAC